MLVFGKHGGSSGDRPAKALRLLSHLEDREKFFKYLKKDFTAFFPLLLIRKRKMLPQRAKRKTAKKLSWINECKPHRTQAGPRRIAWKR